MLFILNAEGLFSNNAASVAGLKQQIHNISLNSMNAGYTGFLFFPNIFQLKRFTFNNY